ncbi:MULTISPECIES: hydroxymethylglutaryl-CoA reductase [unclassified Pseudoclavibacter]|jgi:hydroxymethylglutaryl-CoA reductase (NADPH)|uniref:hydroxymethylglutaryl-CoA reductase n=1 Tax=unclassified Pseudoclavibacter TaxID=2615177 RepID=UPI000CE79816|nr:MULTISPECIES: hydroxymethylglutaryl-CoA reductase [unclassified Pseudoclavibacter]NYF14634.1 hydroxymethylglutaryl-CoA reductase (NADPH) [Pseudoclavibacter sp. JAI123]PPG30630.1 hydroxymethylglutaryl-CoA reductase [Pseudoclavibacter sp. RFBB5]
MSTELLDHAPVPLKWVGPVRVTGNVMEGEQLVPLATYEQPLWPSVGRGAKMSMLVPDGIKATLIDERMSRSVLFEADDAGVALTALHEIQSHMHLLQEVVATSSRFARLIDLHAQIAGNLLFLRFELTTGDASGHNMVTLASERLMDFILRRWPELRYESISGNFCSDKKATAVNGILGRGKNVVTELVLPRRTVERWLRSTPEKIAQLNVRKNLIGTMLAGGLRTGNAHYANMLLGFFLATGQDAANIVEGSQGITHAEVRDGDLYFSCTLPNLIVGSVGNGKGLDFIEANLERLGCKEDREPGANARRLAVLCAATVLCGELSLMAAQTNQGELMASHIKLERAAN